MPYNWILKENLGGGSFQKCFHELGQNLGMREPTTTEAHNWALNSQVSIQNIAFVNKEWPQGS